MPSADKVRWKGDRGGVEVGEGGRAGQEGVVRYFALRREGSEAVGGGGGPLRSSSSMCIMRILRRSSGTHSSVRYRLSF